MRTRVRRWGCTSRRRRGDGARGGAEGLYDAGYAAAANSEPRGAGWVGRVRAPAWVARALAECAGGGRIDGELPASGLEHADHAGRVFSRVGGRSPGRSRDGEDWRCAAGFADRRLGVDRGEGSGEAVQG